MQWQALEKVSGGRNNNYNLLRFILATFVLISHSGPLAIGKGADECLNWLFHFSLGTLGVFGFFFISGFLVTRSLMTRNNLKTYIVARSLRIFPALAVVLIFSVFLLGPALTLLPVNIYFSRSEIWTYVPFGLTLMHETNHLPGVFLTNPYGDVINGSLWTLSYEFTLYIVLAGIWASIWSLRNGRRWTCLALIVLTIVFFVKGWFGFHLQGLTSTKLGETIPLAYCFCCGSVTYIYQKYIRLNCFVAIIVLCFMLIINYFYHNAYIFLPAFFYAILAFSYKNSVVLSQYQRFGDYSYGIYIYAFPIQQMIVFLYPGVTPLIMGIIAFPITLAFAIMSWHFIEKPALQLKSKAT
jgi:peptidoglycan/LPS O-acetylase OafA/YrhL